jgi:hypothetical protein
MRVSSTQESGTIVNEDKDTIILLEDNTNIKEIMDEEITKALTIEKSGRIPEPGSGRAHVTQLPHIIAHASLSTPLP